MELKAHDTHTIFNGKTRKLKCFDWKGKPLWIHEARNDTVAANDASRFFGHEGHCPPGTYKLGQPIGVASETKTYGKLVIPIEDLDEHGPMHTHKRQLIRIHGGPWRITRGCIRERKAADLEQTAQMVNECYRYHATAYLTVVWE